MRLRIVVFVLAAIGGLALTSTAGSAIPNGIPNANEAVGQTSNVEQARWVCGPRGCFRRPNWRGAYGF
jgi:hypothetical protein